MNSLCMYVDIFLEKLKLTSGIMGAQGGVGRGGSKGLLWRFNFEISLDIQIVPSGQEIMVTAPRTEVVEAGKWWN